MRKRTLAWPPMAIAIRTQHLSKTFRVGFWARKLRAVRDLSLDVTAGEIFRVRGLICRLRAAGRTLLFSRHIVSAVEAACDRGGSMIGGRLTDCGSLSSRLEPGVRAVEVVARGVSPEGAERIRPQATQTMQRD